MEANKWIKEEETIWAPARGGGRPGIRLPRLEGFRKKLKKIKNITNIKKLTPSLWPASELYRPSDRRLLAQLVPNFRIESVAWSAQRIPTVVNLGFLDRSRYLFLQVVLQLSSRGWVVPVPDQLIFYPEHTRTIGKQSVKRLKWKFVKTFSRLSLQKVLVAPMEKDDEERRGRR
jgi:hypothetical protein